jgi:hypothetical protein
MTNAALDRLIWTLIYGALIVLCLGVFLQHPAPDLGWTLMALGALGALAGCVLIWVRSRRKP